MELFTQDGGIMLSRWGHYLAGVTWIGLLWYFNFVQTPAFVAFEAGPRTEAIRKLVPRALWWFRYGALLTLISGVLVLLFQEQMDADYMNSPSGISISTGILMALIMFGNVWGIIWPNQKIVIENAERTAAGQEALPNAAAAGRKGACASRTNTLFSIPMLFFMGATSHFAPLFSGHDTEPQRALYWIVAVVLIVAIEAIALMAPAVGAPQAWHIDNHRNTIIAGFVLTAILVLVFEVAF